MLDSPLDSFAPDWAAQARRRHARNRDNHDEHINPIHPPDRLRATDAALR